MRKPALISAMIAAAMPAAAAVPDDIARHVAAGRAAAAPDFPGLASLCDIAPRTSLTSPGARGVAAPAATSRQRDVAVAPRKVFDNLYFVGTSGVSAWVLRTSAGLILIDALNNEREARDVIVAGMARLGLDPAQIKYLVITHGHGDHYGGSNHIVDTYHPRVVMSAADWSLVEDDTRRLDLPDWGPPPKRDVVAKAPRDTLTLGDTSVTLVATPGHTEGTLSLLFPVFDKGRRHQAVLWGGTGFNFGALVDRYRAYARSASVVQRDAVARRVDVFLSNHPARDETLRKFAAMDGGKSAGNPFVLSTARVSKAFDVFRECATANALAASAK